MPRITGDGGIYGSSYTVNEASRDVRAERLHVSLDATFSGQIFMEGSARVQLSSGPFTFYNSATEIMNFREWTSADTDIDGLISGTTAGALVEGRPGGHLTFGIKDNDAGDGVQIISGNGNWTTDETYDRLVAFFRADGQVFFPNAGTAGATANAVVDAVSGRLTRITSSIRYKRDVQPIGNTDWIYELAPVEFLHTGSMTEHLGFIAEEVAKLCSKAGVTLADGTIDNYDDRAIMAALVREVQLMRHDVDYINERLGYDPGTGA